MQTQNDMILRHLRAFGSISPREALELYGCMRLVRALSTLERLARSDAQASLLGRVYYIVNKAPKVDAIPLDWLEEAQKDGPPENRMAAWRVANMWEGEKRRRQNG